MKQIALWMSLLIALSFLACNNYGHTYVIIETEFGEIKAKLYNSTPAHKANFIKLAEDGYYDGLLFHQATTGFIVQGGDPNSRGAGHSVQLGGGGPNYTVPAEIGAPHFRGVLVAARKKDRVNQERRSSGSQFFIVHGKSVDDARLNEIEARGGVKYNSAQREKYKKVGGTPQLDGQYTVFGEVVEGMEVVDKMVTVPKVEKDRPTNNIEMKVYLD